MRIILDEGLDDFPDKHELFLSFITSVEARLNIYGTMK